MSRITLKNVRLAFPNLWKAVAVNAGDKPGFSAAFIFPPNHPCIPELKAAIKAKALEKWGAKHAAILKQLEAQDRTALHNGDTKSQYAGYEGNMFVNSRSNTRPTVIGRDKVALLEEDGKPYAGCYVNAIIELWAQDNPKGGKRVNASLCGVQFVKDGDAFGGGSAPASEDEFDDLGDTGEEDEASADVM